MLGVELFYKFSFGEMFFLVVDNEEGCLLGMCFFDIVIVYVNMCIVGSDIMMSDVSVLGMVYYFGFMLVFDIQDVVEGKCWFDNFVV